MTPRRILVSGVGSAGRRHARNQLALGQRDVALHRSSDTALPADLADLPAFRDLEEALSAHRPDVVFVANPTAHHVPVATAAARAGSHVFIEKPISHTMDGLDTLTSALEDRGRVAMVGYMSRFHPLYRRAKRWLEEGRLGLPLHLRSVWGENVTRWHPWEDYRASYAVRRDLGGGPALTLSHEIDLLVWFLGPPREVRGMASGGPLESDCEQSIDVLLRFDGGAVANVHLDYWQWPPRRSFEVVGTEGRLEVDAVAGEMRFWPGAGAGTSGRSRQVRARPEVTAAPRGFRRNDLFVSEVRYFLSCLDEGRLPEPGVATAAHSVRVALAAVGGWQS